MHVAIIGGASTIGSTVAYTVAATAPAVDVTLVDVAEEAAWAHATDVSHATYHFADAPGRPGPGGDDPVSTVQSASTDDLRDVDPDLVVVTASAPKPDDATGRDAREAELARNLDVADDVARNLSAVDPVPVVVVTNPVDRITYRLRERLDWPRERFLGYSLSETARAAAAVADSLDVRPSAVSCPTMGEHGEHVVPVFSRVRVDGESVDLPESVREEVLEYVRSVPFEIARRRGAEETSRWVTGAGVTRLVRIVADGGTDEPLCLSTPLSGEYGFADGCLGVPVTTTADGVGRIVEWDLATDERERLAAAHEAVLSDLREFA